MWQKCNSCSMCQYVWIIWIIRRWSPLIALFCTWGKTWIFSSNKENWRFKVLLMLLKIKDQRFCFFVAIIIRPRRWVQMVSRYLNNIMLATTMVCGMRLKKSFDYALITPVFVYRNKSELSLKWCAKNTVFRVY